MTLIPTTTFGSWVNIQPNGSGTTPETYVADCLADYIGDYDLEGMVNAFMAELQNRLPAGLTILGNGELIGPAYGPEHDAFPEDVCAAVAAIIGGDEDGEGGIDLAELMEEHDYTLGPFVIHARGVDGEERDVDPQLYPYNDRRTLAQALTDARAKYVAATGLAPDAILLEQLDEDDPVVQDAVADSGPLFDHPGEPPIDRGPATILSINALDLLRRTAISPSGTEFHIDGLRFDAGTGRVLVEITVLDEEGQLSDDSGTVMDLRGWVIQ